MSGLPRGPANDIVFYFTHSYNNMQEVFENQPVRTLAPVPSSQPSQDTTVATKPATAVVKKLSPKLVFRFFPCPPGTDYNNLRFHSARIADQRLRDSTKVNSPPSAPLAPRMTANDLDDENTPSLVDIMRSTGNYVKVDAKTGIP